MSSRQHLTLRGRRLVFAAACLQLGLTGAGAAPPLRPGGDTLEKPIQPGETHVYPVPLGAGDFLRVTVDQIGVDVELVLAGPDGREIAKVDGPGPVAEYGVEDLAAIAAAPGLYQIKVHATVKTEPASRYRIHMEAPRPAGEADRRRIEAIRANQDATNLMAEKGVDTTRPQQAKLRERALQIWQDLGELHREADTRFQLGILHHDRHDLEELTAASEHLHRAVELYRKVGDTVGEAKALNEAGRICEIPHPEEAQKEWGRALELARQAGASIPQANALSNLGLLLIHQGKPREAIKKLEQALQIADGLSCSGCQGSILINLGSAHDNLSETSEAIDLYRRALALGDDSIVAHDRAAAYNNRGLAYHALGNLERALGDFDRANGIEPNAANLNNRGLVLQKLERFDDAIAAYRQAIELAKASQEQEAGVEVNALYNLGSLYWAQKERHGGKAIAAWEEARKLAASRRELEPVGLLIQGALLEAQDDTAGAHVAYERSIALADQRGDPGWKANSLLALSRLERRGDNLQAARDHISKAIGIVESLRGKVLNPELRTFFLAGKQTFYALDLDILMDLERSHPGEGWDAEALQISERARARSLLDLLAESRVDIRKGVDPQLLQRERGLQAEIRDLDVRRQELVHQGAPDAEIAEIEARLKDADQRHDDIEAGLRLHSSGYAALTQPQPLDAAGIQKQVLGDGTLLLEYALGDERSYLWAVTAEKVRMFELPPRKEIDKAGRAFYDAVKAHTPKMDKGADRAGLALSRMILAPVEELLGDRTLLVVSDGILQYIPFAALPLPSAPAEYLVSHHRLVSLPSASSLAVLRRERELAGRPPAAKTLAVLAHPVVRKPHAASHLAKRETAVPRGLPPHEAGAAGPSRVDPLSLPDLAFAEQEAHWIADQVTDPGQKLVEQDYDASLAAATDPALADYRYVHFATHGLLDADQPELSCLVLSRFDKNGRELDPFLRLQDIYNLHLNADLVTLSACQTALGKEIRGEGLIGLTRGFMYAGAARVLASLWNVDDRSTALLMKKFYGYLLVDKLPAAEALRRAQAELARDPRWASPYYWAGFVLQGEWK